MGRVLRRTCWVLVCVLAACGDRRTTVSVGGALELAPQTLDFQQAYDRGGPAQFWGLFPNNDHSKPLRLIANFNNDVSQYWQWSDTGFAPVDLSNEAYKLGVNYIIYGLTH